MKIRNFSRQNAENSGPDVEKQAPGEYITVEFCFAIITHKWMWKPYLKMIAKHLPQAINVLDRFHIMQKFGKALDKVRADEAKRLRQAKQPPLLSKSRWCFLKRRENLTEKQGFKLNELLKMNLRTVKAYLLREQFQKLWEYRSPGWAGKFLELSVL